MSGGISGAAQAQSQVLADDFTKTSASLAWQVYGGACLTAGNGSGSIPACPAGTVGGRNGNVPDSNNNGMLRLTDTGFYAYGGVVSLNSFPSSAGFSATITTVSYGGTGADGISFFLLDAAQGVPSALGYTGGNLGYVGLANAYLGVGLDEYGNFSAINCSGYCSSGVGLSPNSVTLRGSTATSWAYITKVTPGFSLWSNVALRSSATQHVYTISMSSAGVLTVKIDGVTYLSNINAASQVGPIPAYLRIGFAASTGGSTNIHEVKSLSISSLSLSNLIVQKNSKVLSDPVNGTTNPKMIPGATVRYCVIVTNLPGSPTASAITATDSLAGLPLTYVANSIRINGTSANGICNWDGAVGGSFASNTISANLAALAGGASETMYFDATVN